MAQLSGKAAAIKNERCRFVHRQFALQLVKLRIGDTDSRWNVSFVEFRAFRPRINYDRRVVFVLFGDIFNGNCRIVARNFHPSWESVGKNFDIGVAEFFRLPGGFMTQLSGGALAVKNKQCIFIRRQFVGHLVKLTVRDADRCWNMPVGILGFVGPGIDDHDLFRQR